MMKLVTKAHILSLRKKNYDVTSCNNGRDAIDIFEEENFTSFFLDENMPDDGLETLSEMKEKKSAVPMIMITKRRKNILWRKP
jgi:DNA-binding response OmpR family regulator